MSQFTVFCKSALSQKQQEQAMLIQAVAVGAQGDSKGIKETVKKLTG